MGSASSCGSASPGIVVEVPPGGGLPLARARNVGAQSALDVGAEVLIFLDVDCLPRVDLIGRYRAAAQAAPTELLCGPVHYLPESPDGYQIDELPIQPVGHPARPVPPDGSIVRPGDHALFWSLSFAVTASTWGRIGGFDERYVGYGGEDTDFGQRARRADVGLAWVGGAWAFHQHHDIEDPPVRHVRDIVRNAQLFHDTWGQWPMTDWLNAFERLGVIDWDSSASRWRVRDRIDLKE